MSHPPAWFLLPYRSKYIWFIYIVFTDLGWFSLQMVKLEKMAASWQESHNKPRQYVKRKDISLPTKSKWLTLSSFQYSPLIVRLNTKKGRKQKNWCFWTGQVQLRIPWRAEIKPVNPKDHQPWILIGRSNVEAEAAIFGHLKRTADSRKRHVMLGRIESWRKSGWQRVQWTDAMRHELGKHQETMRRGGLGCCSHEGHKSWTQLGNSAT